MNENKSAESELKRKKQMEKEKMQEFVNAIGVLAETSLVFYHNLIDAGANVDEAYILTQAYIKATISGRSSNSE